MALAARQYAERVYPGQKFIWGGHFHQGVPFDRMHFQSTGVSAENFTRQQLETPVLPDFGVKPGSTGENPAEDAIKIMKTKPVDPDTEILKSLGSDQRVNQLKLNVNVKAGRDTKVDTDTSGDIDTKVERSFSQRARSERLRRGTFTRMPGAASDATGGGKIESPA
jgi:hypothetical protein